MSILDRFERALFTFSKDLFRHLILSQEFRFSLENYWVGEGESESAVYGWGG